MTIEDEVIDGIRSDWDALEQVTQLVYELWARLKLVEDAAGPVELGVRLARAYSVWHQLDELGVDLALPDLKTMTAGGLSRSKTSSGAETAQSTPADPEPSDVPADTMPAPLEHPTTLTALVDDTHGPSFAPWQPGDDCTACDSTNTARGEDGVAYCADCGAHGIDDEDAHQSEDA